MCRSLIKLAIVAALVAVSWRLMLLAPSRYHADHYLASLRDRDELLQNTPGPRMIFVGGSNLAFGLDSKRIAERTGLAVINCGLHAGLGLQFMLNQAAKYLKDGDIVVLSPEYGIALQGEADTLACAASVYPAAEEYLSGWHERVRVTCVQAQFTFKHVCRGCPVPSRGVPDPIYRRSGFNRHGDLTSHLDAAPQSRAVTWNSDTGGAIVQDRVCTEIVIAMNAFAASTREKGVRVYFMHPPLPQTLYQQRRSAYEAHAERLRRELHFPVVSLPADFVLPDDKFFDTRCHLNRAGRTLRTETVIAHLLPVIHGPLHVHAVETRYGSQEDED
jgi:hypothetical protein